jgi:hypothetical protein
MLALHPSSLHFKSPAGEYKREYVHDYGTGGTFHSNCFTKGVAEFAGDGLKGNTGVFDAIPIASGRCEATFRNAQGQQLTLHITIGAGSRPGVGALVQDKLYD